MTDGDTLLVFVAAGLVFAVVSGPAVAYIVTSGVDQGRLAGVMSALGIETGNLVHVAAATLGLPTALLSSAIAFAVIRYAGAAYLIYLGIRKLLEPVGASEPIASPKPTRSRRWLYVDGVVVAILNPKTALFLLAFLPQFIDPSRASAALQVGLLGVLLVAVTTVSDCGYALLAGTSANWLRARRRHARRPWVGGGVYIALGVTAALADGGPRSGAAPRP